MLSSWISNFILLLSISVVKYLVIFVIPFIVFWRLWPEKFQWAKIQVPERQKPQILLELQYSASTILIRTFVFLSMWWGTDQGYFKLYNGFGSRGLAGEITAFIIYIVVYDAYFYWAHRALHQGWLYKKVHVIHHRSINPTPLACYSFHPVEAVVNLIYIYPIIYFVPMSVELFFILLVVSDFGNMAGHLGYEFLPKATMRSWWGSWLTTPTHHNVHHQLSRANYGLYWSGWDKIFNTQHTKTETEFERIKSRP